ncbi:hypothetical protein [Mycobacterium leprae]|nr:hypothetical protein [Mycobacterium leprae]
MLADSDSVPTSTEPIILVHKGTHLNGEQQFHRIAEVISWTVGYRLD